MFDSIPSTTDTMLDWDWVQFQPYFDNLLSRPITPDNLEQWLHDYTVLQKSLDEIYTRLYLKTVQDTNSTLDRDRWDHFLDTIFEPWQQASHAIDKLWVDSGLQPSQFDVPMQRLITDIKLFRTENVPLQLQEERLGQQYDDIAGNQTVMWQGEEYTIKQMDTLLQEQERSLRADAWHLSHQRQLADREAYNALWQSLLALRIKIAENAGYDNYRDYKWQSLKRFDYTPQDCMQFHDAIAKVVVPAAERILEKRRQALGVESLRPWDLDVDVRYRTPLRPFEHAIDFATGASRIFHNIHPTLGDYFDDMNRNNLLDLPNRKGKAPGGFCTTLRVQNKPFIFMNAVGIHDDLQTLLHESGHAFHAYAAFHWPYVEQQEAPLEFAEVASMAMELLAQPYLDRDAGGFYTEDDAKRAQIEHLESIILFWPYMAVVDGFQHWVYENPVTASDPSECDTKWAELWQQYMTGVDWSGLDDVMMTGWHRKLHIFQVPFYYIEYGLAQLGAVQVWRNALSDQSAALERYRHALQLGGTASLPDLYAAAGARFTFDENTLRQAVELIETQLDILAV